MSVKRIPEAVSWRASASVCPPIVTCATTLMLHYASAGATVTASISPEVIVTLWEVIPLVVKPKPYVSARFGRATEKITPEDVVDSLQCDRLADTYALEAGLDLGVGIKDIAVPDLVPFVGGVVLIKEKDFGQFPVVPATAFGQCGPLCTSYFLLLSWSFVRVNEGGGQWWWW